jgi:hypothetical protein
MYRVCSFLAAVVLVTLAPLAESQDKKGATEPTLAVAQGVVDKADKDTLMIKPRSADGRFQKAIALKLTGTSKVTVLTPQDRKGKVVLTQRDADAKDLTAGQTIAVIYTEAGKDGAVLLSAVVQPTAGK